LLKKSFAAAGKDGAIAVVEGQLNLVATQTRLRHGLSPAV